MTALLREDITCQYFMDGRTATIEYLLPVSALGDYHIFLSRGYRRMGAIFYRHVCTQCSVCRPIRLQTERFRPGRSQMRTMNKNRDISVKIGTPVVTSGKVRLYEKYIKNKHNETNGSGLRDYETVVSHIHQGYDFTLEMDYYVRGRLIGVGIVDAAQDALSSHYFYYDTDELGRRPGVMSILREISLAESMNKKFYYLGFYIEGLSKMEYKKDFRPNELYVEDRWRDFLP